MMTKIKPVLKVLYVDPGRRHSHGRSIVRHPRAIA